MTVLLKVGIFIIVVDCLRVCMNEHKWINYYYKSEKEDL